MDKRDEYINELEVALLRLYAQTRDFHSAMNEYVSMPRDSSERKLPTSLYKLEQPMNKAKEILENTKFSDRI